MQGFNQPRRGPSKSRPSLAAMLDSIDQDNAGLLDSPKFKPLEPLRPSSSGRFGVDPYDFDTAARLLGDNSLLLDPFATGRSPLKLPKKPPLLIPGLDGPGKSSSGSSVYPQSTSRSRSNGTKSSSEKSSWSAVGNRLFTDEVQATLKSNTREPGIFTAEYNELARKHGLQPLPAEHQVKPSDVSVSSISQGANSPNPSPNANATGGSPAGPLGKGARAINRMLKRTNSTKDISERSRKTLGHPLGQKAVGIKHLSGFRKKKKDGLLGMHLEDMVRLGGVCQLDLPEKMRPGSLLIPACFHATASYILDHGNSPDCL